MTTLVRHYSAAKIFSATLVLLILENGDLSAQKDDSSIKFAGVDSLVDIAVELFYQKKFDEAIKICENVIQQYPENPLGYLGQAGVYHLLMLNYRVNVYSNEFDSLTTLAIKSGEQVVRKYKQDADAFFVLGASYGFRGLHRIRRGEWLGAFYDGIKGITNIQRAHRLDDKMYDVYYALGLFYYWKSVKANVLAVLRLMKDEREKGIEYLKIAIDKGKFTDRESKFALIEIYYYEDRYAEALQVCESMADRFADDPNWNYLMAKILSKLERWPASEIHFHKLLELLTTGPFTSYSYLAECHFGIANCAFHQQNLSTAQHELELAQQFSQRWDPQTEMEGPLLDFDKVLKQMEGLKKELALQQQN